MFAADRRPLGVDRGVVWFEGGLLHYHGAATSFVLAATDLVPRSEPGANDGLPKDALRLRTNGRVAFVRLRPLAGRGMFAFRWRLRAFLRANEPVRAARQWPPLELCEDPAPGRASRAPRGFPPPGEGEG